MILSQTWPFGLSVPVLLDDNMIQLFWKILRLRTFNVVKNARAIYEGLDGGSWYSLITKNLAIYSLSLKFWLIH